MAGLSIESVCREIHDGCWGDSETRRAVHLLVRMSLAECRKVRETFMEVYGEDLVEICRRSDSGSSSSPASLMMLSPFERDAAVAKDAIFPNDHCVDYGALIEIFSSRKSSHVLLILQTYHSKFRRQLDVDIAGIEPLHPYQKILMALSASHKAHHADTSQHIAKCDARRLYQTGEGRQGAIDEAVVLEIFSKRSIEQLKLTFLSYKHIYGHSYTRFLRNGHSGDFEDAVRVVVKCICSPPRYYAKVLQRGLGGRHSIDYRALARVMVSRAEVDLDDIQRIFKNKYGVELETSICENIPEGDHRDFLLALARKTSSTC
ncbi:annexin D8-like [Andrographis paniculata]|uniref:annexin D8-like n=1 Tax=Andrographis paniculata TaxID=175694 RepID=UPI0021E751B9|nr:annexin D8-like [Andrographis paniculata]